MYLGNVHTPTSHCNLVLHTYHPFPCPPSPQSPIDRLSISSSFIVSLELPATCHSPPPSATGEGDEPSALRLTLIHFLIYLCTMHSSILLLFIFCWNLNPSTSINSPFTSVSISLIPPLNPSSHELFSSCPPESHSPSRHCLVHFFKCLAFILHLSWPR